MHELNLVAKNFNPNTKHQIDVKAKACECTQTGTRAVFASALQHLTLVSLLAKLEFFAALQQGIADCLAVNELVRMTC